MRKVLPFVLAFPLDPILNIAPPGEAAGCPKGEGAAPPKLGAFAIALPNENPEGVAAC